MRLFSLNDWVNSNSSDGCRGLAAAAMFVILVLALLVAANLLGSGQPAAIAPTTPPTNPPVASQGPGTPPATQPAIGALSCPAGTDDVVISDADFAPGAWFTTVDATAGIANGSAVPKDGHLEVRLEFGGSAGVLDVWSTWTGGAYDPRRCGPITSFDLHLRGSIVASSTPGARLPVFLILRQHDTWYWTAPPIQVGDGGNPDWTDYDKAGLGTVWAFSGAGPSEPNLVDGEPLSVGLLSAASCPDTCLPVVSVTAAVDDLEIDIQPRP